MTKSIILEIPDGFKEPDSLRQVKRESPGRPALKNTGLAYHYTDQQGLLGIVGHGNIWATDVEFLNDAQELIYARDNLLSTLRAERERAEFQAYVMAGNQNPKSVDVELRARSRWRNSKNVHVMRSATDLAAALGAVIEELENVGGPSESSPCHAYVSCFCSEGDLLSQWRGYGGVGGYSIGFRVAALRGIAKREEGKFDWVRYGFYHAAVGDEKLLPTLLGPRVTLMDSYLKALTMVKNPSFQEEKEWRLMISREKVHPDVKFRAGPVGVTPYIPIGLLGGAVEEIIVGPGRHTMERVNGTYQLLKHTSGWERVRVKPSSCSLR